MSSSYRAQGKKVKVWRVLGNVNTAWQYPLGKRGMSLRIAQAAFHQTLYLCQQKVQLDLQDFHIILTRALNVKGNQV